MDRVDPDLRELDLVPDDPTSYALQVDANVRVMTINVGNNGRDEPYPLRLSYQAYEDFVAERIQALRPDVVGLQEVLPRHTCVDDGDAWETDSARTCFEVDEREDPVRRLVGPDYSIVCDDILQVDCVAVHIEFGQIEGLALGEYEPEWSGTLPLPDELEPCDYTKTECWEKLPRCDQESSMFELEIVQSGGRLIRVVHAHPAALGQACREHQLADGFRVLREAADEDADVELMMLGDWNFDPDRFNHAVEEMLYYSHVGPGRLMREHDERDEDCARVKTAPFDFGAFDRVLTNFAHGFCSVQHESHVPVGENEPVGRFDEEFEAFDVFPKGEDDPGRMDHRTVVCDLYWPERG